MIRRDLMQKAYNELSVMLAEIVELDDARLVTLHVEERFMKPLLLVVSFPDVVTSKEYRHELDWMDAVYSATDPWSLAIRSIVEQVKLDFPPHINENIILGEN